MASINITPTEYASIRGITLQAVTKAIRGKKKMVGVKKISKFGRFYILTLEKNFKNN